MDLTRLFSRRARASLNGIAISKLSTKKGGHESSIIRNFNKSKNVRLTGRDQVKLSMHVGRYDLIINSSHDLWKSTRIQPPGVSVSVNSVGRKIISFQNVRE